MAEDAEFKRGVGTGEQLPSGEASALNEAVAAIPPQAVPGPVDQTGLPQGVEWAQDEAPLPAPRGEQEEILFGPSEGLGRNMPDPATADGPVPASVVRRLPALARAAKDPNAPASLKAMHALIAQRLEEELRG